MKKSAERAKKNFYERVIGFSFLILLFFCLFLFCFILVNGKIKLFNNKYIAYYEHGNGLKEGIIVTLNGINAGQVVDVKIDKQNRIQVTLSISRKYADKIREDSVAQIVRPMMVGGKQICISPGNPEFEELLPGSVINSRDSSEVIDLFSGVRIERILGKMDINKQLWNITNNSTVSANDIYEQAVSAIITMGEFAKVMNNMSENINSLSVIMADMSSSFASMQVLAQKMDKMSYSMENITSLASSMENMVSTMGNMGMDFGKLNSSISGMSTGMKDINSGFVQLSDSMSSLSKMADMLADGEEMMDDVKILLKAFQNNWFIKKEIEQARKELDAQKNKKDKK
ncbi:MAG: MCE family protein [Spirochaetales bacterium]|nr:MCE family protein [Spirochaetales bacterium]